jgi:regulator of sigma E protease
MAEIKEYLRKYLRVVLFFVFVCAVIYFIIRNVGAFGNVLLVMLGFGAVVLVHEFGHFIVAKISNIKVEAFSIFMPPILLGIQKTEKGIKIRILPEIFPKEGDKTGEGMMSFTIGKKGHPGETEYRIGLIPFGGFVKMLGQDDIGSVKDNSDPRSFANKPVSIRAAVITAGVVFNIISAIIIFMITFLIGIDLQPPVVGGVEPNSPAARAGLRPGDEVIDVAGQTRDLDFSYIAVAAALSGKNAEVPLKVRHTDGNEADYKLVAAILPGDKSIRLFGIEPAASLTIAKLSEPNDVNDLFARTGLLPGDRIISINGQDIRGNWELMEILKKTIAPEITIQAGRPGKNGQTQQIETKIKLTMNVSAGNDLQSQIELSNIYSMVPRLKIISEDVPGMPASASSKSLQAGDIIVAVNDVNNPVFTELRDIVTQYKDKPLPVKVLRIGANGREQVVAVTVTPKQAKGSDKVLIGVALALDAEHPVVARTIDSAQGLSKLDIPAGATITAVDGRPVASFYDIIKEIKKAAAGERINLDWRIDQEIAGSVAINVGDDNKFMDVKTYPSIDIPFAILKRTYKASGPINAIGMGLRRTGMFVAQTYVTLRRLIGGLVTPDNLMGPVGIIKLSYQVVSEQPAVYYVYFLGMMSAMIAVFNFLPLPPLDGGFIVLLIIEKIKGAALSEKAQTIIAYTGWFLILALFLYVTFNDIFRIIVGHKGIG